LPRSHNSAEGHRTQRRAGLPGRLFVPFFFPSVRRRDRAGVERLRPLRAGLGALLL